MIFCALVLCFQTGIIAQISATLDAEKTYDNGTRICYFTTDKLLSEQAKDFLQQQAVQNKNILRLSFYEDKTVMFEAVTDFTLDSVVNVINDKLKILSTREVEIFSNTPPPRSLPQNICDQIKPSCSDNTDETYWSVKDQPGYGKVACANETKNPAWFYIQIDNPGDMEILMKSVNVGKGDIDFVCWGPFNSKSEACEQIELVACPTCPNNTQPGGTSFYPHDKITDCSYSGNSYETLHIKNAQKGQTYVILITNFENQIFQINFHKISGEATTDCSIITPPASSNSPVCEGETLELYAKTSDTPNAVYNWSGPNGFTSNEQHPVIENATPANAGTYTLVITADGLTGDPKTTDVVINPLNYRTDNIVRCKGETYNFYGEQITEDCTREKRVPGTVCDTIVTLNFKTEICNIINFTPEEICADYDKMTVLFDISNGTLTDYTATFDNNAIVEGFENIEKTAVDGNTIEITLPKDVKPNYYSVTFECWFDRGLNQKIDVSFDVLYPSSIITQRWNDVLALKNEKFNEGDYQFTNYEWYKNDEIIPNENKSYLYVGANGDMLDFNAVYRARPTRLDDNVQIFTCGAVIGQVDAFLTLHPQLVQAGQQIVVKNITQPSKISVFNILGLPVGEYKISQYANSFSAPPIAGTYSVIVETENGKRYVEKILIQ